MHILSNKLLSIVSKQSAIRVLVGIFLISIAAQVQIPLKPIPIPITLQTAGVLLVALCYSKGEALSVIFGYILFGLLGLPVFAGFKPAMVMLCGPTAGYVAGMVLSIYIITTLREKFGESWTKLVIYSAIGSISLFCAGILYLSFFVGLDQALKFGLYPFILPGIVKALLVASSVNFIKNAKK